MKPKLNAIALLISTNDGKILRAICKMLASYDYSKVVSENLCQNDY